jgi:hypothetical protein
MTMLGFSDYSNLVPQTLYYGACPTPSDEFEDECSTEEFEPETCSTIETDVSGADAQVALDLLMSLSLYLRENRDVISREDSGGLYYTCSSGDQQSSHSDLSAHRRNIGAINGLDAIKNDGGNSEKSIPLPNIIIPFECMLMAQTEPVSDRDIEAIIVDLPDILFNESAKGMLRASYTNGQLDDAVYEEIDSIDFDNPDDGALEFNAIANTSLVFFKSGDGTYNLIRIMQEL